MQFFTPICVASIWLIDCSVEGLVFVAFANMLLCLGQVPPIFSVVRCESPTTNLDIQTLVVSIKKKKPKYEKYSGTSDCFGIIPSHLRHRCKYCYRTHNSPVFVGLFQWEFLVSQELDRLCRLWVFSLELKTRVL